MITTTKIGYVAGIIDGEGWFLVHHNSPVIGIKMTDLDVIEKVKSIINSNTTIQIINHKNEKHKTSYCIRIFGSIAASWMMTIYPLVSNRRKKKIKEILVIWRNGTHANSFKTKELKDTSLIIKNLAKYKNISIEEARKLVLNNISETVN